MHPTDATSPRWLTRDLLAALSLAGLLIPESVAYASLAHLPASAGIAAAVSGLLFYGLIGSSRFAAVAATSSSALVLAAAVAGLGAEAHVAALPLAAALVLMCGALFLTCAALRLGQLAHFVARPVVRGLALGLAIVIIVRQVAAVAAIGPAQGNVLRTAYELWRHAQSWNLLALGFAAGTLGLLLLLGRWPRLPATLCAVVAALLVNAWLGRSGHAVPVVGPIALTGIRPQWPALAVETWLRVAELALPLTLLLFAESYGSIRVAALRHGDVVAVNRDLLAMGLANVASGLCGGLPVGAGYSATNANESAGARSRAAGLSAALIIVLCALLLLHYLEAMPLAALAGIIIYAMRHALSLAPLRSYYHWQRDRLVSLVAILAVLLLGVVDGLLVSIALSMIMLLRGLAQPRLTELGRLGATHDYVDVALHADARAPAQCLILRPEAPLFFANVSVLLEAAWNRLQHEPARRTVVLSLEETPDLDGTVVEALEQFSERVVGAGRELRFARLKAPVLTVLRRSRLVQFSGVSLSEDSVATVIGGG